MILERAATGDRFVNARSDAISRNGCFPRKNILRVLITVHDSRMDRVEFAPNSRAMIKPSSLKATSDRKGGRKTVVSRLECYEKSLSLISFNERCLNQVSILNISFLNPEFSALTLRSRKDDISSSLKNKRKKRNSSGAAVCIFFPRSAVSFPSFLPQHLNGHVYLRSIKAFIPASVYISCIVQLIGSALLRYNRAMFLPYCVVSPR